jgi:hypothetical protein
MGMRLCSMILEIGSMAEQTMLDISMAMGKGRGYLYFEFQSKRK